jgi:hypothetical protein
MVSEVKTFLSVLFCCVLVLIAACVGAPADRAKDNSSLNDAKVFVELTAAASDGTKVVLCETAGRGATGSIKSDELTLASDSLNADKCRDIASKTIKWIGNAEGSLEHVKDEHHCRNPFSAVVKLNGVRSARKGCREDGQHKDFSQLFYLLEEEIMLSGPKQKGKH